MFKETKHFLKSKWHKNETLEKEYQKAVYKLKSYHWNILIFTDRT